MYLIFLFLFCVHLLFFCCFQFQLSTWIVTSGRDDSYGLETSSSFIRLKSLRKESISTNNGGGGKFGGFEGNNWNDTNTNTGRAQSPSQVAKREADALAEYNALSQEMESELNSSSSSNKPLNGINTSRDPTDSIVSTASNVSNAAVYLLWKIVL